MILSATIFAATLASVFLAALIYKSIKALRNSSAAGRGGRQGESCRTAEAGFIPGVVPPTAPSESECKRPRSPPPSYAAVVEEDRAKATIPTKEDQTAVDNQGHPS